MSRHNRNLLIPRRVRSAASQERLVDQPHNFRQTERNSGNGFGLPAAISRGPRPEIRPASNFHRPTNFKKLSEKQGTPGDKAPATLNQWDTLDSPLDRNPTKRGGLTDSCAEPIFLRLFTKSRTSDLPITLAKWFSANSLVNDKELKFCHRD